MGAGDAFIAGNLAATLGSSNLAKALADAAPCAARACEREDAWGYPLPVDG
jgi:sugar/nucleoside kinase (ribokinase family)